MDNSNSGKLVSEPYGIPLNLLDFVAMQDANFATTLVNCREEFDILTRLQNLYCSAMSNKTIDEQQSVIFSLLSLVHYHFLFSTSCFMRCHMAEAFGSARIAIDATFNAAQIMKEASSIPSYIKGEKPFKNMNGYYKKLIEKGEVLPHSKIKFLTALYDYCSSFASHADAQTFAHRIDFTKPESMRINYFQFPKSEYEISYYFLCILHAFVMTLDVFSNFIVHEHKSLPQEWQHDLYQLGAHIENMQKTVKPLATKVA